MKEIWIPELISSLLLFLFLIRPLVKGLWPLEGLAWFPLLAFGILAAVFPAYGFRPECVPLLANQGIFALASLGPLLGRVRRRDVLRKRGLSPVLFKSAVLGILTAFALFFAPLVFRENEDPVRLAAARNEAKDQDYTLYIYESPGSSAPKKPLLFLIPPDTGSVKAVDRLCAALRDRGFSVLSYQRRGFSSPANFLAWLQSFRWGRVFKKANRLGRDLEEKRREDIEFLLPHIRQNNLFLVPGADPESLILAGWDSGGAALTYLADAAADVSYAAGRTGRIVGNGVRGIVVVESRFWSLWKEEERQNFPVPPGADWFLKGKTLALNWLRGLFPLRIKGLGTLPRPRFPILYLASDWAFSLKPAEGDYAAAYALLRGSANPAAIASFSGAGPLDYTDYPVDYPLYPSLFPGRGRKGFLSGDFTGKTADLIANFSALLLQNTGTPLPKAARQGREKDLYVETWSWNLPDPGYILNP
ncbi:MAG: hypothetical protein LBR93_02895 [Treponema sp.]|jgi:hypothetical protein|nr:hypothetical protein [Treponema sp.]